jgi:hypothetical protein
VSDSRSFALSLAFALLAGLVVWPPVEGALYWLWLPGAAAVGDLIALPVAALAGALGLCFAAATGVGPRTFLAGGLAAYLVGMALIEATLAPESPGHLVLYGFVLLALAVGVTVGQVIRGRRRSDGAPPH